MVEVRVHRHPEAADTADLGAVRRRLPLLDPRDERAVAIRRVARVVDDQRVEAGAADDHDRADAVRHLDARAGEADDVRERAGADVDDVVAGAAVDLDRDDVARALDGDVVDAVVAVDVQRQNVLVRVGPVVGDGLATGARDLGVGRDDRVVRAAAVDHDLVARVPRVAAVVHVGVDRCCRAAAEVDEVVGVVAALAVERHDGSGGLVDGEDVGALAAEDRRHRADVGDADLVDVVGDAADERA